MGDRLDFEAVEEEFVRALAEYLPGGQADAALSGAPAVRVALFDAVHNLNNNLDLGHSDQPEEFILERICQAILDGQSNGLSEAEGRALAKAAVRCVESPDGFNLDADLEFADPDNLTPAQQMVEDARNEVEEEMDEHGDNEHGHDGHGGEHGHGDGHGEDHNHGDHEHGHGEHNGR
ncbi:hypothetical protein LTR70_002208 [Exophiala xenobiotica]|uniref:Uncharacterized protein n=1 Tax=Lithohypha guttulata TaxID=1690604 RepID=A0ABR0KHY0_9EURO|nr:hypothetical protein LTR24_002430 [Lithohypha guttulata]KAK5326208.1 hypothetical protein LTR70_002208 [Exophiala xenobiotica]